MAIVDGVDPFREAVARRPGNRLDWQYREPDPDAFGEELVTPAYAAADRLAAVPVTVG